MSSQTFLSNGSFISSNGVSYTIECWGAGGAGRGGLSGVNRPCGGGGGGYSLATWLGDGSTVAVTVGMGGVNGTGNGTAGGDSSFGSICLAKGGGAGTGSPGAGGPAASGIGSTKYSGGDGGTGAAGEQGGGGGGSAGTGSNGNVGEDGDSAGAYLIRGAYGGAAVTGGGAGGDGGLASNGSNGQFPGGGGGGGDRTVSSTTGGSGANGQVMVSWTGSPAASGIASGYIPLYICGPLSATGTIPLYTSGPRPISGSIPLYIAAPVPPSGTIPLFISATCGAALRPDADILHSPSGHFFNFLGASGNVAYYTYVNSDPLSAVTDTDFISVIQSGHKNRTDRIFYTNTSYPASIKAYNITAATTTNYGLVSGRHRYNKEGFIFYNNQSLGSLYRFREDALADSGNPQSISTLIGEDIAIDNRRRKIYTAMAVGGSNMLYRYDYNGNNAEGLALDPLPGTTKTFDAVDVDTVNNLIYVAGTTENTGYVAVVDGRTFTRTCVLTGPTTGTVTNPNSIRVNGDSGNSYVTFLNGLYRFTPSGCNGTGTSISSVYFTAAVPDPIQGKLYLGSGSKVLQTNANLSGAIDVGISDGTIATLDTDGPGYKAYIDFNLGNLSSGFGLTEQQQATNVWVDIQGREMYDYTSVYAKVYTSDKQKIIWENYPESCAQFFVASGLITQQIGLTGSAINGLYNQASDWNNSILRLYFYSDNFLQPSGSFRLYSAQVSAYCSGSLVTGSSTLRTIPLVMVGNSTKNSGIPLFTQGNTIFTAQNPSGVSLYSLGHARVSNIASLFISGDYPKGYMSLYTSGPVPGSGLLGTPYISLFTYATTNSGVSKNTSLFTRGDKSALGYYPLYIKNADGVQTSGIQPLYIGGTVAGASRSLTMFLKNNYSASGTSLYTAGRGYSDPDPTLPGGGIPFQASFPLYMHRPDLNRVMPLFLCNTVNTSGIPLYLAGANSKTASTTLVIPTTLGGISGMPTMFISGW